MARRVILHWVGGSGKGTFSPTMSVQDGGIGSFYHFEFSGRVAGSLHGRFTTKLDLHLAGNNVPTSGYVFDTESVFTLTFADGTLTGALSAGNSAAPAVERPGGTDGTAWTGDGTWTVSGGTGAFTGATGSGTCHLHAWTDPTTNDNRLHVVLEGELS